MVGSPYQAEIRTVAVPIFTSNSYRRGLEFQLTEAVQKQIQLRTPFRLEKEEYAETILTGKIINLRKKKLGENRFDDPRQLETTLIVKVSWEDVQTGKILAQQDIDLEPEMIRLMTESSFAPEVGQSLATSQQEAIDRMARRIIDMMETPW